MTTTIWQYFVVGIEGRLFLFLCLCQTCPNLARYDGFCILSPTNRGKPAKPAKSGKIQNGSLMDRRTDLMQDLSSRDEGLLYAVL